MSKLQNEVVQALSGYSVRRVTFEGRPHIIVPVVLLVEGVHHGSGGPMFYSAEEISKFAAAWNGEPVPVYHPTDEDSNPLSCNSPEIIERQTIGRLWNTVFDAESGKLRSEAWIDVEKARRVDPAVLRRLMSGGAMEVSTGLWSDDDQIPGEWNGEHYNGTVRNIRPDHLALLPDQTGACSFRDGCGVRANKEKQEEGGTSMAGKQEGLLALVATADKADVLRVFDVLLFNELSFEDVRRAIQIQVDKWDKRDADGNPIMLNWVVAVYPSYFIYRVENYGVNYDTFLLKKSYNTNEDGTIVLGDDAVKVREDVNYIAVNSAKKEEVPHTMEKTTVKTCCPDKVNALIKANKFPESDREALEALSPEAFARVESFAMAPTTNAVPATEPKTETAPPTLSDLLALSDADTQAAYAQLQADAKARKDALVSAIMANTSCKFTADELNAKSVDELGKINAMLPTSDYGGAGSVIPPVTQPSTNAAAGDVLEAPSFTIASDKK